jgi:D-alanine-D-alanine ligase
MAEERRRTDLPVLLLHNLDDTWEPADFERALEDIDHLETALRAEGHPVINVPVYDADLEGSLRNYDPKDFIVLNWCEELPGVPRSEALVAEALEDLMYTYTGSTPAVLAVSWDKEKVKRLLDQSGLPTPLWRIFDLPQSDGWNRFPAIVKPTHEHASACVTPEAVVLTPEKLHDRIAYVIENYDQPALVEDFIDGREFHVTLWGDDAIEMLPPAEMDFGAFENVQDRLCTFDSKFSPGSRHYDQIGLRLPAPLDEREMRTLETVAQAAYQIIGCRDYARLDIRLRDGIFFVLDVNPNPDISSETSIVYAAQAAGYSYGSMMSRMLNLAARRHPVYGLPFSKPGQAAIL